MFLFTVGMESDGQTIKRLHASTKADTRTRTSVQTAECIEEKAKCNSYVSREKWFFEAIK